jgi:hypothetical protein
VRLAQDDKASRAAEFHHRALTEPYVSLSTHTAPSIRPFAYFKRLCLSYAAPPITGWPPAKAGYRCPFGPAPLQDFQPYYGQLRPCVLHRSIDPHRGHRFECFPSHQDDRFPRSVQKPVSESRRLRAGCRLGRTSGLRPSLSRDDHMTSVSTSTMPFRPFIDGLLSLVSPRRTKAGPGPALSATLTTTALNGSSLQRFASSS